MKHHTSNLVVPHVVRVDDAVYLGFRSKEWDASKRVAVDASKSYGGDGVTTIFDKSMRNRARSAVDLKQKY